ncbi:IS630 family transposase [Noviherbaspirillum saxi]|uniref:IS630 family transposase n=1 Tax=Noviherbaspirillum saxi TaxID=2320863 RepID=A0A3A3FL48_9BURK|nr:IS630 family transposase [Noviherbaspirillum saxi]RJF92825.1 IS630 family transposase [Noviherbaspirillum saxi]RJF96258.1 IS630 family transposase [Noviherbaspirillum saxi]RJF96274.1 IS630 family transposase [Noviherbaspirillum saxi]RJF96293.1 IS630 family transposase [Noviherbaspirillum saxi]RJF96305.1 IS630 family transposase [Noviherbaspirillum saxi]
MNEATTIKLSGEQRSELERRVRSQTIDARAARRARIVLLAADGVGNHEIARRMEISRGQVIAWRRRFAQGGVAAIDGDLPRSGRKRRIDAAEIVRLTTQTAPKGATHWSTRTLAAEMGISDTTVHKAWKAHGLKPHLVATFKVSRDPRFAEKLEDIVGLYLSPPEHALVLCCDEKSQVQALDRTQPGLPLKKGKAATMTHDYKRHGTTTLFAAMCTLDGAVISRCAQRHRHGEWLDFLRQIDRETPKEKELHLICDNYATHKHPTVRAWLEKHPRFHLHFTPTSASWLNMVERFFRSLSTDRLERGVFRSVPELIAAIDEYIAVHNENPKPFVWTAKSNDILQKVIRANRRLGSKKNEALH